VGLCVAECPADAIAGPVDETDELTDNERLTNFSQLLSSGQGKKAGIVGVEFF